MRVFTLGVLLLSTFSAVAGNGGGTESPLIPQCGKAVQHELEKGTKVFTKTMVNRLALVLKEQGRFETIEEASRSVILQLAKHKIPFEV
jgi:hypothetical protein